MLQGHSLHQNLISLLLEILCTEVLRNTLQCLSPELVGVTGSGFAVCWAGDFSHRCGRPRPLFRRPLPQLLCGTRRRKGPWTWLSLPGQAAAKAGWGRGVVASEPSPRGAAFLLLTPQDGLGSSLQGSIQRKCLVLAAGGLGPESGTSPQHAWALEAPLGAAFLRWPHQISAPALGSAEHEFPVAVTRRAKAKDTVAGLCRALRAQAGRQPHGRQLGCSPAPPWVVGLHVLSASSQASCRGQDWGDCTETRVRGSGQSCS